MSRPIPVLPQLALFATLAAATAFPADAATRSWPVLIGPGCNGSLQQCIDTATAGDTVRIIGDDLLTPNAYTAIDEDIVVNKSLTLEASPGIDAVFAPGRTLFVDSPTTGLVSVTLRRLVVRAGGVRILHRSFGDSTYTLDRMRIDETAAGGGDCAIDFDDRGEGRPSFVLGDSTLRFRERKPSAPAAVCARGGGGPWQVSFFRNVVDSDNAALASGMAILGTSSGNVTLSANQLFMYGSARGVVVSQNPGSTANVLALRDNLVTGQVALPSQSEFAISVVPTNTELRLVNNTVARNSKAIGIGFRDGDATFGRVANNIVAFNESGLGVDTRYTTIAIDRNLVFGNLVDGSLPGTGTIGLDPQFVSMKDFRLRPASPARDSGNNADVATLFGIAFDADGERRIANATVDVGAFEWLGEHSFRHVASGANTSFNSTRFDGLPILGPLETLVLTPLRGPVSGPELADTLGVFQEISGAGTYYAFHEDTGADLTPGRRFHALVAARGATGFLHTSTSGSVVDAYSRISHPELDSNPGAIAFVTHNWNPGGGAGIYHDHRLGLDYAAPNWFVGNQDNADMLSGRSFNIVVAPVGSPNAFVQQVGGSARAELRLEHALLDDNECATLQVGRNGSTLNNTAFSLEYRAGGFGAPGHWFIVAEGAGAPTFPANTAFNVMVSGAQANACRTPRLFSNGFE
jgi:hypothetical protein